MLAHAPAASAEQMEQAIAAAKDAFPSWSGLSFQDRSAHLIRDADALEAHRDDLARLLTLEQGKPLHSMATFEVDLAISWVREAAKRSLPIETVEDTDEHVVQIHHVPLGVVGAITPWNFPILLALWKVAPCLVTGNTMVLKPSPYTPLGTLRFAEIAQQVLPAGVLNVVCGADDFVAYAATKKVGDGLDPDTDLGPIQHTMQYGKLVDLFDDIRAQGYTVPLGGEIDRSRAGNWVPIRPVPRGRARRPSPTA